MRAFFLAYLLLSILCSANAQPVYQLSGAGAAAMGGAAVAATDVWAVQYNIGALAALPQAQIAVGYQTRFNLPELSTAAVALGLPLPVGTAGLSISRYGFGAHSLQEASLGFAHQLGFVSLGLQAGLVQVATKGFGSRFSPVISMGGTAALLPDLQFGGFVYNINQSRLNPEIDEYLPTILRAGLQWRPGEIFLLLIETEKDVDFPARFKAGFEYRLRPIFVLRSGFSTNPVNLHGGLGIRPGRYSINYALEHHRFMGLLHHVSFAMQLKDEK